jgi:hypothetical protein
MTQLMATTDNFVAPTRSASQAFELFQRLAESKRRLADIRGEMRNIIYTTGRVGLGSLRPDWVNRAEQLAHISNDLMRIGHRMAATERTLYQKQLNSVDLARLESSEIRRTRLLTKPAAIKRRMQHWASLASFFELTNDVAKQSERISKAEAELATARHLLKSGNGQKEAASRDQQVRILSEKATELDQTLGRVLELLRRGKAQDYINQSPHRAVHKFLSQYAVALNEESEILEKAREHPDSTAARILSQDASETWKHWKFLARETYAGLKKLDKDITDGLTELFSDLQNHENHYEQLNSQLQVITSGLEAELGSSVNVLLGQYSGAIGARLAKHQKWRADLDWIGYAKAKQNASKIDKQYDLEKQMLQENLNDLEQGALWTWPEQ